MKTSKLSLYLVAIFILLLGFTAIGNAGVNPAIKDWDFLKFLFWICIIVGNWVVSAIVTHKVVQIKIKMHDEGIFTLGTKIGKVEEGVNKKLYKEDGSSIYVPRPECDKEKADTERRHDKGTRALCKKIEKLEEAMSGLTKYQGDLAVSVSNLVGKLGG